MHIMKYYSAVITSELKKKWNELLTHATACHHVQISKKNHAKWKKSIEKEYTLHDFCFKDGH